MLRHVVLGLLRDGRQRHGYQLIVQYKERTGIAMSAGNVYRELGRLHECRLVTVGSNPPGVDPRRIPYRLTEAGAKAFDRWLAGGRGRDKDTWERMVFLDRLSESDRNRLLKAREDAVTSELATLHGDGMDRAPTSPLFYDPAPLLKARRTLVLQAELAFIRDARSGVERSTGDRHGSDVVPSVASG